MEPFILVIIVIVTIFALWRIYSMYQVTKDKKEGWFTVEDRPSNIPKDWIIVKDKYGNSLFYKGTKNEIYSLEGKDLTNHFESPGEGYLWIDGFGWWFFPGSKTLPRDTPVLLNIQTTKDKRWYFADRARNKKFDNMFYEIGDKNKKPGPLAVWDEKENIWISQLPTPVKPEPEAKTVVVTSTTTQPPVPVPSTPAPVPSTPAPVPSTPAPVPSAPVQVPSAPVPEVVAPNITKASLVTPPPEPKVEAPVVDPLAQIKTSSAVIQATASPAAQAEIAKTAEIAKAVEAIKQAEASKETPTLTITTTASASSDQTSKDDDSKKNNRRPATSMAALRDRMAAARNRSRN